MAQLIAWLSLVASVASLVSMAKQPGWRWAQLGRRKWAWMVAQAVGVAAVGVGLIIAVVYFAWLWPSLVAQGRVPRSS